MDKPSPGEKSSERKFDPVRAAALEAIMLVEQGEKADQAVKLATDRRSFQHRDIRFLMQLVNGTTKMRRRLDYEIKFFLARPAIPLPRRLQNILRLGFYQLLFTDRVPEAAAVSESVNLAHHYLERKQARLVNAVLRTRLREPHKISFVPLADNPRKYLADYYSFPDYFVHHCLAEFGVEKTRLLLVSYNKPPQVTYRVNLLKAKPDEVSDLLTENEIGHTRGAHLPEFIRLERGGLPLETELIRSGKVFVQDESSGLPVRLLNPRPGMSVVDLTAAPGGKATHAAIRMKNRGLVTAVDKSNQRLELVVKNAQRLGIRIIAPVASDMADFSGGPFDRVLLDPPCSGWGTARKHSDLRWAKTETDIENLTKVQTKMIDRAARLVKPGGVMVYSTCTIMRAENDQIVEEFLARNDKFELESAGQFFDDELVSPRGFVKTYPSFPDLDGSFCARLVRKQEN